MIQRIKNFFCKVFSFALIFFVKFYQAAISPVLGYGKCRFIPSCSMYAIEAFQKYGTWLGVCLAISRIAKCGPWHEGGYDPLPEPDEIRKRKFLRKLLYMQEQTCEKDG